MLLDMSSVFPQVRALHTRKQQYIHTYVHEGYIQEHIQACTHTFIYSLSLSLSPLPPSLTHTHAHRHTHTYTHTHTYIHTYIHTYEYIHTYTHTSTYIHIQTHKYIHTYIPGKVCICAVERFIHVWGLLCAHPPTWLEYTEFLSLNFNVSLTLRHDQGRL